MSAPTFIEAHAVADILDLGTGEAFLSRRAVLEDDFGFPCPVPWCKRPLKWRCDLVLAWVDRQGLPRPETAEQAEALQQGLASGTVVLMALARAG